MNTYTVRNVRDFSYRARSSLEFVSAVLIERSSIGLVLSCLLLSNGICSHERPFRLEVKDNRKFASETIVFLLEASGISF